MKKEITASFEKADRALDLLEDIAGRTGDVESITLKEIIINAVNGLVQEIEELEEEIQNLKEEVDSTEHDRVYYENKVSMLEDEIEVQKSLTERLCFTESTFQDQMKNKILSDMAKNLSLEELENIEAIAKESVKNYITFY